MGTVDRQSWPPSRIVQINLARIGDRELKIDKRLSSMAVIQQIGIANRERMDELAPLLNDAGCPPPLKKEILKFLLDHNYSNLEPHLVPMMTGLNKDAETRSIVLQYLANNPSSRMLAEVVRAWASKDTGPEAEESYRRAVKSITDRPWDSALISAVNSNEFDARPEALTILAARLDPARLKKEMVSVEPATDTAAAAKTFIEEFNYIPAGIAEIRSAEQIFRKHKGGMKSAASLNTRWKRNYGYSFTVKDFHLISGLAEDPLRTILNKTQLILTVGEGINSRIHTRREKTTYDDRFWVNTDSLSIVDLWNLYLIDEMLGQARTQLNVNLLAENDYLDKTHSWRGLVFYRNGEAELLYYPSTDKYAAKYREDSSDCLCRFFCHFGKINNAEKAGPSAQELDRASRGNYYGLVFTRTGKKTFVAHYYNPRNIAVSLGRYPLRELDEETRKAIRK